MRAPPLRGLTRRGRDCLNVSCAPDAGVAEARSGVEKGQIPGQLSNLLKLLIVMAERVGNSAYSP